MTSTRRAYCPECGAQLRRGQPTGALCDPCQYGGPDPRQVLPADFYDQPRIVAPLGLYDFGVFFRRLRTQADWSQQTLGTVVDMHQSQISAIERGLYRLRDIETIARVCTRLVIPPVRLGFPDIRTTVIGVATIRRKVVSWVDRRDFGQHIAALVLGTAGLDIHRLIALLPQSEPTGTRHVGAADVEVIEQATATFMRQDFAHGGGLIRDTVVSQLHTVLPLLGAQVAPEVRPRMMVATASLAMQAGWMSFECQQHDTARRLWMIVLDIARATDDPRAADLTVFLLNNMALQAVHLGRPKEALHLVELGEAAAVGRYPVSAATTCCLLDAQAQAYAAQDDVAGCDRALNQAEEHFAVIDSATCPSYGVWLDDVHLASFQGAAHYTLALPNRDPHAAGRAVPLLRHAVDHWGLGYARPRASSLTDLAGAYALAGDVNTAVTVGHQAVDAVTAVSSPRAHDRLHTLNTVLEPLHASAGVAELRDRLTVSAA